MTEDEIIEMANDAELCQSIWINDSDDDMVRTVISFAKLVAAKKEKDIIKTIQSLGTWATCEQIEKAIKVRGIK